MLPFGEQQTIAGAAGLEPQARAPGPQPAPGEPALRRVNVADKRVINGQTDVNQLVPFKYKWPGKSTSPPAPTTGCRRRSR